MVARASASGLAVFAPFMANAWLAGTLVAIVSGAVGLFVVVRQRAFAAHAIPNGAFAGAAGATLIGASPLLGLVVFAVASALGVAALGRRRDDVVTALALVTMLALGAALLAASGAYEPAIDALLFGELLGVSRAEVVALALLVVGTTVVLTVVFRPLLYSSLSEEIAAARGVAVRVLDATFLVLLAVSAALAVPVVGALLTFALTVGPPAAARMLVRRPGRALALAAVLSLACVWAGIASAYWSGWPIGFFVGVYAAVEYVAARAASSWRDTRARP